MHTERKGIVSKGLNSLCQEKKPNAYPIHYEELREKYADRERKRGLVPTEMVNLFLRADMQITVVTGEMDIFSDKNTVEAVKQIVDQTSIGNFCLIGGRFAKRDKDGKILLLEMLQENQKKWMEKDVNSIEVYCNDSNNEDVKELLRYHCVIVDAGRIIVVEDEHDLHTDIRDKRHLWIENDFQLGYHLLHNLQFVINELDNKNEYDRFYSD